MSSGAGSMTNIPWTTFNCGGPQIHGTSQCKLKEDEEGNPILGSFVCVCPKRPKMNFPFYMQYMVKVKENAIHLNNSGDAWKAFTDDKLCHTRDGVFHTRER